MAARCRTLDRLYASCPVDEPDRIRVYTRRGPLARLNRREALELADRLAEAADRYVAVTLDDQRVVVTRHIARQFAADLRRLVRKADSPAVPGRVEVIEYRR